MNFQARYAFFLIIFAIAGFIGWNTYTYIFDTEPALITLTGIGDETWCAGDTACTIMSNKKGDVSIFLDDQPLINEFKMSKAHIHPFTIPTKQIANGTHTLKTVFIDRTYNKNKTIVEREFLVDNAPLQAALIKPDANAKVFQGRTLHVQFQVNKPIKGATITALSENYPCFPESKKSLIYEAYVPVQCEEKANDIIFSFNIFNFFSFIDFLHSLSHKFYNSDVSAARHFFLEMTGRSHKIKNQISTRSVYAYPRLQAWPFDATQGRLLRQLDHLGHLLLSLSKYTPDKGKLSSARACPAKFAELNARINIAGRWTGAPNRNL